MLIVNVHDWYTAAKKFYGNGNVDYRNLVQDLFGNQVKLAYGRQSEKQVPRFATLLKKLGFQLDFGKPQYEIDMALEISRFLHRGYRECVYLGSQNLALIEAVRKLAWEYGVTLVPVGFKLGFPNDEQFELDERNLMVTSEPVGMSTESTVDTPGDSGITPVPETSSS
jgi:hypothetical protein